MKHNKIQQQLMEDRHQKVRIKKQHWCKEQNWKQFSIKLWIWKHCLLRHLKDGKVNSLLILIKQRKKKLQMNNKKV